MVSAISHRELSDNMAVFLRPWDSYQLRVYDGICRAAGYYTQMLELNEMDALWLRSRTYYILWRRISQRDCMQSVSRLGTRWAGNYYVMAACTGSGRVNDQQQFLKMVTLV